MGAQSLLVAPPRTRGYKSVEKCQTRELHTGFNSVSTVGRFLFTKKKKKKGYEGEKGEPDSQRIFGWGKAVPGVSGIARVKKRGQGKDARRNWTQSHKVGTSVSKINRAGQS